MYGGQTITSFLQFLHFVASVIAYDLNALGVETVSFPGGDKKVDVASLMKYLGEEKLDSVLVEGGGTLNESILKSRLASEVKVFIAPKIFGGISSKTPVEGCGVDSPADAYKMKLTDTERIGEDILLSYVIERS